MRPAILAFAILPLACTPLKTHEPDFDAGPISGGGDRCGPDASVGSKCEIDAPSCKGLPKSCAGESCCTSILLEGGTFFRGYDQSNTDQQDLKHVVGFQKEGAAKAQMFSFWLDRYEVTVGRFRRFVDAYGEWIKNNPIGAPTGTAGANAWIPGSEWRVEWKDFAAKDATELRSRLGSGVCGGTSTWTDSPAENESKPVGCVWWYDAFLFCIWDGGRLPTEAEWNFAAAGGDQQRAFPWSLGDDHVFRPSDAVVGTTASLPAVAGSITNRDGRYGHRDLAGNVWEWTLDTCDKCTSDPAELETYPAGACTHCATLGGAARILRGGSFKFPAVYARTAYRLGLSPGGSFPDIGLRCARNPPGH